MTTAGALPVSAERASLYTPELLALAVSLADYPLVASHPLKAEARSRVCGSVVAVSIKQDENGSVTAAGVRASACAVGQAAAALFARGVVGLDSASVADTRRALADWLSGQGAMPDWPGLNALSAALPHTGRHPAVMLPWDAAVRALSIIPGTD